jgi:catalase
MKRVDKSSDNYLTTNLGVPISNNQNYLTVGERGPVLLKEGLSLIQILSAIDLE